MAGLKEAKKPNLRKSKKNPILRKSKKKHDGSSSPECRGLPNIIVTTCDGFIQLFLSEESMEAAKVAEVA